MSADHEDLLEQLRRIAGEVDAPPAIVEDAARAAFLTRRLDEEIAELVRDSGLTAAGVRGTEPRLLTYALGELALELQVEESAGLLSVAGLLSTSTEDAATGTAVQVETQAATVAVDIDEAGWFRVDGLDAGPVRVRIRMAGGTTVSTGWVGP
jgi:hypothetical protein